MLSAVAFALPATAQQPTASGPIASVPIEGVAVSGSLSVADGKANIANNGSITAGDSTAHIALTRGGQLAVCATTQVHLSRDSSLSQDPAQDSALMIALDRGALETDYATGKYSDVILTPDLRILVSGPGHADLKIRLNRQGDTCIDNHGPNPPYVTVTSQFEGGVYRIQPNQRVMFQHGSLQQVVDNEPEPCGCPAPALSVASTGTTGANPAKPGQKAGMPVGGPSSTPADTSFPLAVSEGLTPPPAPPTQPVVPAGTAHAMVQAPIGYNSATTPNPAAPDAAGPPPAGAATSATPSARAEQPPKQQGGFFHAVGHFFAKMFGR
ncbi:hypothetical protein [Silvibacterium dinghuense]|uniref:Uncharacterized protein n=1 Tax=Silvibacterium dinghuense TaxID=1560006 RepID=A0A4Q1SIY3_9BACT|nr:hypothetical protein [Silvibacterium dinghuense]RXS97369.1 hypothetical protein ESZ00_05545 [Silvibacterium dinghuense]